MPHFIETHLVAALRIKTFYRANPLSSVRLTHCRTVHGAQFDEQIEKAALVAAMPARGACSIFRKHVLPGTSLQTPAFCVLLTAADRPVVDAISAVQF